MGDSLSSKVDIYFLPDSTGSMGSQLDAVKKNASLILEQIHATGVDVQFGVGSYRDFDDKDKAFIPQQSVTADLGSVTAAISQWQAYGGGDKDIPEAQLYALDQLATALKTVGWRPRARRIVVWFGDAPGHDPICKAISGLKYDITEESVTQKLKDQRIQVVAVSTPGQGLDLDPRKNAPGYVPQCGEPGGSPGQANRIAAATGGSHTTGVGLDALAATIVERVCTQIREDASSEAPVSPAEEGDRANWAHLGRWDPVVNLPNAAIHTHVLPSGRVLFWGRRDYPTNARHPGSLHEHECTPYIWDPKTDPRALELIPTPQPTRSDGTKINLFCSGHAFFPDGRLLVAGGHIIDNDGLNQACIYDYQNNTWTALPVMNAGRWYPTVTTLWDGRMLVSSGSYILGGETIINAVPQIWDGRQWTRIESYMGLPLYPHFHVAPDGRVFMSGTNARSHMLNTNGEASWTPLPMPGGARSNGIRDYAPSVLYDAGKVLYVGGGNASEGTEEEKEARVPTDAAEVIDLSANPPTWRETAAMHFPRRQHNATILADGTVLVTGGTSGHGFNDLSPGKPVHIAELWDPGTEEWTELAAEDVDRCYHATAVLLPDATVLSAGGGEFAIDNASTPNDPKETHRDAQIFHPPYLFQGPRPEITSAPEEIDYGKPFSAKVSGPDVERVTLIRLSSVTHSFNQNQLCNVLQFSVDDGSLTITAPSMPEICPPGHYMLFVLSKAGVPSHARILRIGSPVPSVSPEVRHRFPVYTTQKRDEAVTTKSTGTRVTVGLTATCPYGLGACWGGAYEALTMLKGVAVVRPIANNEDSTAEVYLHGQGLPDLDGWPQQFASWANASYHFRGVEVTVVGTIRRLDDAVQLTGPSFDAPVRLMPLGQGVKVQWDRRTGNVADPTSDERDAYQNLVGEYQDLGGGDGLTRVTGPLTKTDAGWVLYVREFEMPAPPPPDESYDVRPGRDVINTRPGLTLVDTAKSLGFLADLAGTWRGTGFNVVSLPVPGRNEFFLMLNSMRETLKFEPIGGQVPNRGSKQADIDIFGLRYLQEVSDEETGETLHVEPGFWLNVPSTTVPKLPATVVRQGTIPHGNSMLALGTALEVLSGPQIDDVDSTPITQGPDAHPIPPQDPYMEPFRNPKLPRGFKLPFVKNPALALKEAIRGQNITRTVVLEVSTAAPASGPLDLTGGIVNMPFDVHNASATRLDAIFWIETVEQENGSSFLQLQYTQIVNLDFIGVDWPHISVATLIKL